MYVEVHQCRACGFPQSDLPTLKQSLAGASAYADSQSLIPVFDLGIQPLANDFTDKYKPKAGYYPLKVMYCPRCSNAQLSVVVDSDTLYRNYKYVTSQSEALKTHLGRLSALMLDECHEGRMNSLVEIGSNDGAVLEWFLKQGVNKVCGIDPATNLCNQHIGGEVHCVNSMFDSASAARAVEAVGGHPSAILARHCFCHIHDWKAFVHSLDVLAGPNTVTFIEVPHAQELLDRVEFDTVYHEHLDYLSIEAVKALLANSPFYLYRVEKFPIHGGSMVLVLRRRSDNQKEHPSVEEQYEREDISVDRWCKFAVHAHRKIAAMAKEVSGRVGRGERVVGYGASAKSTVWINACGFTPKDIRWVSDTTLQKLSKQIPGSSIPVVDSGALTRELPDAAVCFAWNFWAEIQAKEKLFVEKGGTWIVPHAERNALVAI